jgi:hypothetical protein
MPSDSAERPECEGDLHQHLRRHSARGCAGDGVVAAAKKLNVKVPIILRLEGTNVEEGRKILKDSGLELPGGRNDERSCGPGCRRSERWG